MSEQSFFTPGAEVVIFFGRWDETYKLTTVAKVHKTGRFVCMHDRMQQWSPHRNGYEALPAGRVYSGAWLYALNGPNSEELKQRMAKINLRQRFASARHKIDRLEIKHITAPMVDGLETVLRMYATAAEEVKTTA